MRDETLQLTHASEIGPDTVAGLNRSLVEAGIDVHELRLSKAGLEEIVLQMAHDPEGGEP